ncbi:hypothetical protein ACX40Y_09190 [Sphingomonas sp. RS6]
MAALFLAVSAVQDRPASDAATATVDTPQQAADGTQRWSVLVDPCASAQTGPDAIVVCGKGVDAPRLPLPAERGPPDRPMPGNPDMSGAGALALTSAPCAARMEGCTTGIDLFGAATTAVRLVGKAVDPGSCCEEPGESTNFFKLVGDAGKGVGRMFRKKPDKSNRVPIDLGDPVPAQAGRAVSPPSPAAPPIPPAEPASPTGATGEPSPDPSGAARP